MNLSPKWLRLLSVLLLLIHWLMLLPLFVVVEWSELVLICNTLFPFKFYNHLSLEERAGCFTCVVFVVVGSL